MAAAVPDTWIYKIFWELKDITFVTLTVSVMAILNDVSGGNEMIDNTILNIVMVIVALVIAGQLRTRRDPFGAVIPGRHYYSILELFSRAFLHAGIAYYSWKVAVDRYCDKPVRVEQRWIYSCRAIWPGKFVFLELLSLSLATRVMLVTTVVETCFRTYDLLA